MSGVLEIPMSDGAVLRLDVDALAQSVSRVHDVAIVNVHKAPELLCSLNDSWLKMEKIALTIEKELVSIKAKLETTKSCILLDECTDEKIRQRGHSKPSADLRKAIVTTHPEVKQLQERIDQLTSTLAWLRGHQTAVKNAYYTVSKLIERGALPNIIPSPGTLTKVEKPATTWSVPQTDFVIPQPVAQPTATQPTATKKHTPSTVDDAELPSGFGIGKL